MIFKNTIKHDRSKYLALCLQPTVKKQQPKTRNKNKKQKQETLYFFRRHVWRGQKQGGLSCRNQHLVWGVVMNLAEVSVRCLRLLWHHSRLTSHSFVFQHAVCENSGNQRSKGWTFLFWEALKTKIGNINIASFILSSSTSTSWKCYRLPILEKSCFCSGEEHNYLKKWEKNGQVTQTIRRDTKFNCK